MLDVSADQALAFRVAGHHLDRRVGAAEAVAAIGLQEYPPGWGALAALAARSSEPLPPDVVTVNAFRGSPYVVLRDDARVFTGGAGAGGRGRVEGVGGVRDGKGSG